MARRTTATIAIAAALLAAAAMQAGPVAAQAPGGTSRMPAPGAPAEPVGPCERNANLLQILIPPDVHAIPVWIRPFTDHDETPPDLLALWTECRPRLAAAEPLIDWAGRGRGLKPLVDVDDVAREADAQRRNLPDRTPTDRQLRQGDPLPATRP